METKETENLTLRSNLLVSKLTLRGVDHLLRGKLSYRSLPSDYFSQATKPQGEQFDIFRQLCKWLFLKAEKKKCAMALSKIRDPLAFATELQTQLGVLGIAMPEDMSLNRFGPGYGKEVLFVLEALSHYCLKEFRFRRPEYPKEEEVEGMNVFIFKIPKNKFEKISIGDSFL